MFDLNSGSAGFLIFVYAVLNCQHMYMRLNCAERGLLLDTAEGLHPRHNHGRLVAQ